MTMRKENKKSLLLLVLSMTIFGTIGVAVRYLRMPSSLIAMVRGYIGAAFLFAAVKLKGGRVNRRAARENLLWLALSGAAIGFNWILLFEAYRFTQVATATLCYYMQPVFVTVAAAILFREKLSLRKILCILAAVAGMVLISGIQRQLPQATELKGILCGLSAGALYASVILFNKKMRDIDPIEKTMFQLLTAALVVTPYVFLADGAAVRGVEATLPSVLLLLLVGVFHTGFAYTMFFGQIPKLPAQTVAIVSYIDPVVAIILSAVVLHEQLTAGGVVGAILIIGSAVLGEL